MNDPYLKIEQAIQPYLLKNAFILTDLPAKDLAMLQETVKFEWRKRGEMLFRRGNSPKGAFWLKSGKAKIFQETPDGQRQTLYIYSNGDLIGYRQLISGEANPVSCILLEDTMVGFIPGKTFRDLLDLSPFFARNILTALAREFSVWMNRTTVFAQLPVRLRLVLALLILHEQYRQSGSPPGVVTITRTELAEYLGTSLETVVRALHVLKDNNLVHIDGRRILLPNPDALVDILL